MEDILSRLLVADTNVVQEATAELKEAFKKPETITALFQIAIYSQKSMVRQYAAVLLRKRYAKGKNWSALSEDVRTAVKELILMQGLMRETELPVRNAIVQLIGTIVKHELPNNGWPQVFQIIRELVTSDDEAKKELGMYALATMTGIAPDAYIVHSESIMTLLGQVMSRQEDSGNATAYYFLQTMLNLVPLAEGNQVMVNAYHQMMVPAMTIVQTLANNNEERATEMLDLFDELCDQVIVVIGPHVKELVAMCLTIARNTAYGDDLRSRAITLLGTLIQTKKKAIVKHKIVEPIIDVLYELMSAKTDDDEEEDYFTDENEEQKPSMRATHAMHLLALHFKPEKLIPHLLSRIKPSLDGNNPYAKKAAYLSMAVLAEGCSEHIRNNYLPDFLQCVRDGIMNENAIVRNAAMYAAGHFSGCLQPEISRYSDELLPVLFHYLERVHEYTDQENGLPRGVTQMFFALETFCENLNEGLLPYLPTLMQRLLEYLNKGSSLKVHGLVFSAIGAAATASKENMLPYFQDIMSHLNRYLTEKQPEETLFLQVQAVETLGALIRSIGAENLTAVIGRSLEFGLNLIQQTNDPDIRKVVYGLFASISTVMKKDMAPALPKIVEYMIESIQSSEGIVSHYKDEETGAFFPVYEDVSDNENEDEADIENTDNEEDDDYEDLAVGFSVANSYVEEKEEAILALREIAQYTEDAFLPYLEKSFEETFKTLNYPQEDIRAAAIDGLLQFCINLSQINTIEGKQALHKALSVFVPKLSELIRLDSERMVAINGLGAYATLLKEVKADVLIGEGHRDAIMNCVTDVMTEKTECQDHDEGDSENGENEAEEDELLIECAGDVFSAYGKIIPAEDFALHFQAILPLLQARSKASRSEAQRSFAIGTIAECIAGLRHTSAAFVEQLLPLFHKSSNDVSPEVRNNAFYGLGELILHSKEAMYGHYTSILSLLIAAAGREDHAGPRDNMIGVIARMIVTNYSIIDINQVFPLFVKQLPLEQDFEEYHAVFNSVVTLYRAGHEVIKPYLQELLKLAITVLHEDKAPNDETKEIVIEFIKSVHRDFPDFYNAVHAGLSPEVAANMLRLLS